MGKMKSDQEEANGFARHVFAIPKDPVACSVLAMIILVFTGFRKWFSKILVQSKDAILTIDLIIMKLGSHSFWQGIATLLANNPGCHAAINTWLRAGWNLGSAQSRT